MNDRLVTLEDVTKSMEKLRNDKSLKRYIINLYKSIKYAINNIPYCIKHIKWYYQRTQHGMSDKDVWNFDYYLAKVIVKGITELRLTAYSYPAELHNTKILCEGTLTDKVALEEWDTILFKIAIGFDHIIKLHDGLEIDLSETEKEEFSEAMDLFKKYYVYLWN